MSTATNRTGLPSPITFAPGPGGAYPYRKAMGMVQCAEWSTFFDDFYGSVTTNLPLGWTGVVIDVGATVVVDTTVGSLGATGVLLFDSDGATEGSAIYGSKSVQLTTGKRFFMEMRFQTEIADDSDVQFGLTALTATTNPEDLWTTTATDVVAFGVLDGSASLKMLSDKANTGSAVETAAAAVLVSNQWHTLAIHYDGLYLHGYLDGAKALTWSQAASTIPTGVALAPFFGFRNGSAATTEGHCDYVRFVIER
jgi:hypothetical protein